MQLLCECVASQNKTIGGKFLAQSIQVTVLTSGLHKHTEVRNVELLAGLWVDLAACVCVFASF